MLTAADYQFFSFVSDFGRSYATREEFNARSKIFKDKLDFISQFNSDESNTHTLGINEFMDRTEEEMKKMLGYKPELKTDYDVEILDDSNLEASVDWRSKGAVTPVKNQGGCGSCWAFSTTGAVEGAMKLHGNGSLQSYSEQQLVDCSKANNGCHGGLMDRAFKYIETAPLMLESDYRYTGRDGSCKYNVSKGYGRVRSYKDVSRGSSSQLKAALGLGPVSVAIEADKRDFQQYKSGVITGSGCGTRLDHGVLAVGYGTESGQDYFLVKNSWGSGWGDRGYVKIGANNVCGILMQPSYPTE